VIVPPLEVPAGGRVSVAVDPQGAAFGLFDGPFDP
jgi:predicted enzyme related to lactoylglutathione lyase